MCIHSINICVPGSYRIVPALDNKYLPHFKWQLRVFHCVLKNISNNLRDHYHFISTCTLSYPEYIVKCIV